MPRDRLKVVIVGAGIGGLSAHLACARAGFDVEHFERQPHLGAAGAGIVVWPDGVKVLESLGLGERLASIGNRPDIAGAPRPGRSDALGASAAGDLGPDRRPGLCRQPHGPSKHPPRGGGGRASPDRGAVRGARSGRSRCRRPPRGRTGGEGGYRRWGGRHPLRRPERRGPGGRALLRGHRELGRDRPQRRAAPGERRDGIRG